MLSLKFVVCVCVVLGLLLLCRKLFSRLYTSCVSSLKFSLMLLKMWVQYCCQLWAPSRCSAFVGVDNYNHIRKCTEQHTLKPTDCIYALRMI
jgi:hypothetical protein